MLAHSGNRQNPHYTLKSRNRFSDADTGFSVLELLLVLIIVCILVVIAVRRFADTGMDAEQLSVQLTAGNLATSVAAVHRVWQAQGGRDVHIHFDESGKRNIIVNDHGWPIGISKDAQLSVMLPVMTIESCMALWQTLLQGVSASANSSLNDNQKNTIKDDVNYWVKTGKDAQNAGLDDCLYVYRLAPQHVIRYDSDRGHITYQ